VRAVSLCALVIALSGVASSAMLANAAEYRYAGASIKDYRKEEKALEIAEMIKERFMSLAAELEDYEEHPVLENIRAEFGPYGIKIEDASSGLHLDFLSDGFLAEIAPYVFKSGNADGFIALRNSIGLTSEKEKWKGFVKEEVFPDVSCYGWLNNEEGGDYAKKTIAVSRGARNENELFPVMNSLPSMNVNNMRRELLEALLSIPSWKISAASDKAKRLSEESERGAIGNGVLRTVLALPETHKVYRYLGVKTQFWRVSYRYEDLRVSIILAAIPEISGRAIAEYKITERSIEK
jgi:hypothetical protein